MVRSLELLFTATVLALVPYAVLRGPFNRRFMPSGAATSGNVATK